MEEITFKDLNLSEEVLQSLVDMGFVTPSPIQAQSIPVVMDGKDIIGQAQTGTGKTAAFGIPAIEKIDTDSRSTQVIVICPTRELAMQVCDELNKLGKYKKRLSIIAVYGGAGIDKQIQNLRKGAQIVVGTPGRLMDHLDRGTLKLNEIKMVVLDEADEMLDMGFREDIEDILSETPEDRQTVFFSATMPKPILELTKKYQNNPITVKIFKNELTVDTIDQKYIPCKEKDKTIITGRLIDFYEPKLCLVFCNTKRMVDELVADLQETGYSAEALHGDMRQVQRSQVMNKFRQGAIQILAATDVAARGIDVDDVEMVINFDLPLDTEYYVHRIGRTGRAGRKGTSISLVSKREIHQLKDIERFAKTHIKEDVAPTLASIEEKKRNQFLKSVTNTIEKEDLDSYRKWVNEIKEQGFSLEDISAALIRMELHHQFLQYSMPDVVEFERFDGRNRGDSVRQDSRFGDRGRRGDSRDNRGGGDRGGDRGGRRDSTGMSRLFINLGRNSAVSPRDIVGAITGEAGITSKQIGQIDIYDRFSFVEVEENEAKEVIKRMKNSQIKGYKFSIEIASDKDSTPKRDKGRK